MAGADRFYPGAPLEAPCASIEEVELHALCKMAISPEPFLGDAAIVPEDEESPGGGSLLEQRHMLRFLWGLPT